LAEKIIGKEIAEGDAIEITLNEKELAFKVTKPKKVKAPKETPKLEEGSEETPAEEPSETKD